METTYVKTDYVVFDGKNLIELLQFARSKNVEYIGEYDRLMFIDGNGKKQWINNNDIVVRFFGDYHVVSPEYFQKLIVEQKLNHGIKGWYTKDQIEDLREWMNDSKANPDLINALGASDLSDFLSEALNHIEQLQNIIGEVENG